MRIGLLAAVLSLAAIFASSSVSAQEAVPLVRRSGEPTPAVVDRDVLRQQRVELLSPATITDPVASQVLEIDLFQDVSLRLVRDRLEPTAHGVAWFGRVEGYPESDAIFVLVQDELVAHVFTPFGFFRVQRDTSGAYLAQQVSPTATPYVDDVLPREERAPGASLPPQTNSTAAVDDGSVIDVMVAYTGSARVGFGSDARALATIDTLVAETNRAMANTGVNTRIRLVRTMTAAYAESGNSTTDLDRLRRTSDGFMDDVPATRDLYAADLVVLITEQMESSYCGRGFILSDSAHHPYGFSVVARRCTNNGRTFAHELGHNIGAHHDWYVTAEAGANSYAKGYTSLNGRFLDLMSYWNLCTDTWTQCAQLLQYSNPRLFRNGYRTGVAIGTRTNCVAGQTWNVECDADVATTFNWMRTVVARFRNSDSINNHPPTVTASCNPCTVQAGQSSNLTATATDPDGDSLTYRWTAARGALSNANTANTVWTSPTQLGSTTATIAVNDGRGGTATATVTLQVVPRDRLNAGSSLLAEQALTSGNGRYRLLYQRDGNLVLYDEVARTAPWATGTSGRGAGQATLQGDGNFVIYGAQSAPVWATGTAGSSNAYLLMQNDGNLVLYSSGGQPIWDRFR